MFRCVCYPVKASVLCAIGNNVQQGDARRRAGKGDKGGQDGAAASGDKSDMKDETAHITVTGLAEVQSDLNPQDPLQKVVRFSSDLSLLLTGGTDGHIRVWEVNTVCHACTLTHLGGEDSLHKMSDPFSYS